ncbi:MAG: 4Fe-4S binding protein [Candidatus Margulisiibacteriota bacterium]
MKLPGLFQLRILAEAVKAIFFGPYTSRYPYEPTLAPVGFRGKPQYYEEDCVGCGACAEVCPARAIEVTDDLAAKTRTLVHHQDQCVYCQQCERACITEKGIKLTTEYELSTFDRRQATTQSRKKLVLCEHCGNILGAEDHLRFLAKKVGPLLYANPTLMMARSAELKLYSSKPEESPHKRAGHLRLLCPNCRREMILAEQW